MTVKELDVVTLPDGRTGTVVSLHPDGSYVVEVSDEAGRTLDLVDVPGREAGNAASVRHQSPNSQESDAIVVIEKTANGAIVEADGWSFTSCPGCGALVSEWLTEEGPDTMEFEECPMCIEATRDEEWWF